MHKMGTTLINVDIARVSSGLPKDGSGYNVGTTRINVKSDYYPQDTRTFERVTHSLQDAKIGSITHRGITLHSPLKNSSILSIFYWTGDEHHEHPLLLELEGSYYGTDGSAWMRFDGYVDKFGVMGLLNSLNCRVNGAHILDISQHGDYKCTPGVCNELIRVMASREGSFTRYIHSMGHNFNVGSITHSGRAVGLRLPYHSIQSLTIHFYITDNDLSIPLAIACMGMNGYKVYKNEMGGWNEVPMEPGLGEQERKRELEAVLEKLVDIHFTIPASTTAGITTTIILCAVLLGAIIWKVKDVVQGRVAPLRFSPRLLKGMVSMVRPKGE